MASNKVLRTGSSYTTPFSFTQWLNGQNGTIVHTFLALEAIMLCLVPLQGLRGGANHNGVVSRYQVPDPNLIHHISLHPSGWASRATREDHRVTKCSRILLDFLGSVTSVVGLAKRPQNAR